MCCATTISRAVDTIHPIPNTYIVTNKLKYVYNMLLPIL